MVFQSIRLRVCHFRHPGADSTGVFNAIEQPIGINAIEIKKEYLNYQLSSIILTGTGRMSGRLSVMM